MKIARTAIQTIKFAVLSAALFGANLASAQDVVFAGEQLTPKQNQRFSSSRFGDISIVAADQNAITVWSHAANAFLQHRVDGSFFSWELGDFKIGPNNRWLESSRFGWVHIGLDEQTYGGWIYTAKYDWIKIERPGNTFYFWIPRIRSWSEFSADGDLYSFEWGRLVPQDEENKYHSSRFGFITVGDFGGWVKSEWFGWLWAPGGGQWVWASDRQEWLGILSDDEVWSTAENKSYKIPPPTPPLEERIGIRGPKGGFVWKPKSEADHKLVVLIPASLTDGIKAGWIADKDGNVVENGRYVGSQHNGGREHYRFSKAGGGYGRDIYFVSRDRNNQLIHWPIPNGAARWDY